MTSKRTRHSFDLPGANQLCGEVMELIADVCLACAGRDAERPAYSESYLRRKLRKDQYLSDAEPRMEPGGSDALLDSELSAIVDKAGLTTQQEVAWRMHLAGARQIEIAARLGVSHTTAARFIRQAEKKVQMFYARYGSLHSVYEAERRKYVYRKPSHCRQAYCRKLGYCKFALSLKHLDE